MAKDRKALLEGRNMWGELIALRDRQREETKGAAGGEGKGAAAGDQPRADALVHASRSKDTVVNVMMVYQQEIPPGSRSGRSNSRAAR